MSFWTGQKLSQNSQVIQPFSASEIDCNSYNLRMGSSYYRTAEQDTAHEPKTHFLDQNEAFVIPPGQFAFLLTAETVSIPKNAMAFISMRTGVKWQGLINVSGFHVDPGYNGKLIYAVYNASPTSIQIKAGDPIFKIWFADLDEESEAKFVYGRDGLTEIGSDITKGMSREILSLQNLNEKIRTLEKDINQKLHEQKPVIESLFFVWRAIVLSVVFALLYALFSVAYPEIFKPAGQLFHNAPSAPAKSAPKEPEITTQKPIQ